MAHYIDNTSVMMNKGIKRFLLFLASFSLLVTQARASHLMGGEITWECLGTGEFVFQMKLYRDCSGAAAPLSAILDVINNPSIATINLSLVSQNDISPQCNVAGPTITCAAASPTNPIPGAVEEYIYQSAPTLLNGTPPPQGWVFTYDDCCRNNAIINLQSPNSSGFTLRAIMYAFNNQNMNPCYDSSPKFLESPKTIICTGYPFTYNHNAVDVELDSITFDWAEPLNQFITSPPVSYLPGVDPPFIPFVAGFSMTSPMPGTNLDPNNIPATLDPSTGEISYTSYTQGAFVTCVKVQAWKCGQLVAEVFREIQVILLPCGANSPPDMTPPFQDPVTGLYTLYADTVVAGQLVTFTLAGSDFEFLPSGSPQTLTMTATGLQFGAGYTNTASGCLNPPCAVLNPPPPVSGSMGAQTTFTWQTDCSHISYTNQCFVQSNTYNFVIRTADDFCPAPAQSIATISITVLSLPVVASPDLHCLAVDAAGGVTLTWDQPLDTGGTFNSYHIYSSANPNGPFTVVDSVFNYNQLSYTHAAVNANTGPVYYYVQTRSGCGTLLPPTDTLSTIYLQVVNNNNLTATLNWNNISNPPPQTQFGWFRIYKEYPTGVWTLIDSTQQLTYTDSIPYCNITVNYRIEIGDSLGCVSVSNIDGILVQDVTVPNVPLLDSVSVNAAGNAVLGWQPSTSTDVTAYIVFQYINGLWTAIDTVFGYNNTSYTNNTSNADQQSELYVVAAVDSCSNVTVFSSQHRTLFVSASLDICNAASLLSWNSYSNMPGGVAGYTIWFSENGGPLQLAGNVGATDTTFTHTGLTQFSTYCYYIQAVDITGQITSTSQEECLFANVPQLPVFEYLRVATVNAPNTVEVRAYVDVAADISSYAVYRSETQLGPWLLIGSQPFSAAAQISFTDNTAETSLKSYWYKMVATDSCGAEAYTSNLGRTILLQASANNEITNTLIWNDYEGWASPVLGYNIYRMVDGVPDPASVASVPFTGAGVYTYTDVVDAFIPMRGRFSYYIEAVETPVNVFGFADTSYSNVAEVAQKPLVFVPNAFTPNGNGINDLFMPSTGFVDVSHYEFAIFNRWGELLYKTNTKTEGWDGRFAGDKCMPGVYVWTLTFRTAEGEFIDQKGTVTLIR
jgi:gliding motility-associated-like protein